MPITIRREANGNVQTKEILYRVGSLRAESLKDEFELSSVRLYEVLPDGTKDPCLTAVDVADKQDNKTFIIEGNPMAPAPAAANQAKKRKKMTTNLEVWESSIPSTIAQRPWKLPDCIYSHRLRDQEIQPRQLHTTVLDKTLAKFYWNLRSTDKLDTKFEKGDATATWELIKILSSLEKRKEIVLTKQLNDWGYEWLGWNWKNGKINKSECDSILEAFGAIILREDKIGGPNSELRVQSYYAKYHSDPYNDKVKRCKCPTILMTVFGTTVSIFGAVTNSKGEFIIDHYITERFLYQPDELGGNQTLIKIIASLRLAVEDLMTFYQTFHQNKKSDKENNDFPWMVKFKNEDEEEKEIIYISRIGKSNVFLAAYPDGTKLIVKWAREYNRQAHDSWDSSPTIFDYVEKFGWIIIAMEYIDGFTLNAIPMGFLRRIRGEVAEKLRKQLDRFQEKQFIHGDLRPPNVIVTLKKSSSSISRITALDFDWAGQIDEECPPRYNNPFFNLAVDWPEGVFFRAEMKKIHDDQMLMSMIQQLKEK